MSTFNISEAANSTGPYPGSSDQQGYCSGIFVGGSNCGTMNTGAPQLNSTTIEVITFVDTGGAGQISLCVDGTLSQNYFYELQFTDHSGVLRTYLTSAALTFDTASQPGYSIWTWTSAASYPFNGGSFNGTFTYTNGVTYTVPAVTGLTVAAAEAALAAATGAFAGSPSNTAGFPLGIVLAQSPTAGSLATAGSTVTLSVGAGPIQLTAKAVSASTGKAIMMANVGAINPRIYEPQTDPTARHAPPRLPL